MDIKYNVKTKKYVLGTTEYSKEDFISYIESDMLQSAIYSDSGMSIYSNSYVSEDIDDYSLDEEIKEKDRVLGGENIILYGVPGSGKSYTIEKEFSSDENRMIRVVFHPDYMNTDFIGQILPTIKEDGTISYEFVPGPFTNIMRNAYKNYKIKYYLVIEEINRGNAPAIFGDVFQLLDRDISGTSRYGITNSNLANVMYGDKNKAVKIPSNLTILATMNTADQNVFTLDTAFQRRWNMRMIENNVNDTEHANIEIVDTGVTWARFNSVINNTILDSNISTLSSEDKRLGAYFITPYDLRSINDKDDAKRFAEKIIKYLWDDAFKFSRDKLFETSYKSLDGVILSFINSSGESRLNIFKSDIKDLLLTDTNITENFSDNE